MQFTSIKTTKINTTNKYVKNMSNSIDGPVFWWVCWNNDEMLMCCIKYVCSFVLGGGGGGSVWCHQFSNTSPRNCYALHICKTSKLNLCPDRNIYRRAPLYQNQYRIKCVNLRMGFVGPTLGIYNNDSKMQFCSIKHQRCALNILSGYCRRVLRF